MTLVTEQYVHFLLDVNGRPPQRCRVSFAALAALEGTYPATANNRDQCTRLFMKHRRLIEAIARMKFSGLTESTTWVTVEAEDLTLQFDHH
jgi:hypothetical protein